MPKIETLHSHTTASDGKLTHLELLEAAEKYNISVVAFTDHDTLPETKTLDALRSRTNQSVKWIAGIEISSGLPKELGQQPSSGLHIVGLFVDPTNYALKEHCAKAQEARIVRMQKIVQNLKNLGFEISEEDCRKASGGEAVGRPHIVEALKTKPKNLEIMENLRLQMGKEALLNKKTQEKYAYMLERGEHQYPYLLFLDTEAYIKDVYVEYQYWTDLDHTVALIRNAGGLSVLAHYHTINKTITPKLLEKLLEQKRLDGIETVFGLGNYATEKKKEIENLRNTARNLAHTYNRIVSGGADAHEERDLAEFAANTWFAEETTGMTQVIINQTNISTEWSSF